jgi:hypothetical protein
MLLLGVSCEVVSEVVVLQVLFYDAAVSSGLLEVDLSGVEPMGQQNFSDKLPISHSTGCAMTR